ncbi:glycerophosphodiester phosphodiesterase domain-containing protein 5-like isoform X2 [Liolophura sinensis]|uniref:glycerophosphodiester phosphodiesterase domain-containing protein 5-like isoform X2 n=1 Tax=Liolophura sinensis TaxID=3198878 RepID=UPI003158BF55
MCLTLLHVTHGHQLYVYPVHLILSLITLACCVAATVMFDRLWRSEWTVLKLSLQITGPFLHIGAVILMTLMTWIIAGNWLQLSHKVLKTAWLCVYIGVMTVLYLCPLVINSPCVVTVTDLPPKPEVIGHRGAPAVAPENTILSFQSAASRNVWAFESDVRISFDGVPFLLHDSSLRRTTNISSAASKYADVSACWFNISEIKVFDAGSWYLTDDPYGTVSYLSEAQRQAISRQKVPTFAEMLQLAILEDRYVIFDLFTPPVKHPYHNTSEEIVVETILRSGIDQKKILWLRRNIPRGAENFTHTSGEFMPAEDLKRNNFRAVNLHYDMISEKDIRRLNMDNITTNIYIVNSVWMFSLYWCVGVHSVSTDQCQVFAEVDSPVWHMSPKSYLILWIAVDVLSAVIVVLLFIVQRVRLYGTKFNPETLSLQSGRTDSSYEDMYKSKNMKQKLLRNGDPFEIGLDQSNGSLNSSELPVGSYCLHTMNGNGVTSQTTDDAPVTNTHRPPVTSHTEIHADVP